MLNGGEKEIEEEADEEVEEGVGGNRQREV